MNDQRPPKPNSKRPVTLAAPQDFKAVFSKRDLEVVLSWSPLEKAESYILTYLEPGSSQYENLVETNETTYSLLKLQSGKYRFQIKSKWGGVESQEVEIVEEIVIPEKCSPPEGVETKGVEGRVELEWSDSEDLEVVQVFKKQGIDYIKIDDVTDSNYFFDTEVEHGNTYSYKLKGIRNGLESDFTEEFSVFLEEPATNKTDELEVNIDAPFSKDLIELEVVLVEGKPEFSWKNDHIEHLFLLRKDSSGSTHTSDLGNSKTVYKDMSVEVESTYFYQLENNKGEKRSEALRVDIPKLGITPEIGLSEGGDEYDPACKYFFIYGVPGSGKTALMSSIVYSVLCNSELGALRLENEENYTYQKTGIALWNEFLEVIPAGNYPRRTVSLSDDLQYRPKELKLKFIPNGKLPEMNFAMLDMAGEDLKSFRDSQRNSSINIPEGIIQFLDDGFPMENLSVVCLYPSDFQDLMVSETNNGEARQLSIANSHILSFIQKLDKFEKTEVEFLLIISKWDLIKDKYKDGIEFLRDKAPVVLSTLLQKDRNVSVKVFTIGDARELDFSFDPTYSEDIFKWMYHATTGVDLEKKTKNNFLKWRRK